MSIFYTCLGAPWALVSCLTEILRNLKGNYFEYKGSILGIMVESCEIGCFELFFCGRQSDRNYANIFLPFMVLNILLVASFAISF